MGKEGVVGVSWADRVVLDTWLHTVVKMHGTGAPGMAQSVKRLTSAPVRIPES